MKMKMMKKKMKEKKKVKVKMSRLSQIFSKEEMMRNNKNNTERLYHSPLKALNFIGKSTECRLDLKKY